MDKVIFNEETHQYFLGDKELISVTRLLKKHGLAPDYSGVNLNVLNAKAERGSLIHKELENYVKNGELGFTEELSQFIELCEKENIQPTRSEFIVNNDIIAGTVDTFGLINHEFYIGDFKTTSVLHKESVSWQLSLYAYLGGLILNKFLVFHFTKNGLKLVEINPVPIEEVVKLIECERNGLIYEKPTMDLAVQQNQELFEIQMQLQILDESKKVLEEKQKIIKDNILKAMEQNGIKKIDNEFFTITYVKPTTRETIDSKRLKLEQPEIASQYTNISNVNASLRIKIKEGN